MKSTSGPTKNPPVTDHTRDVVLSVNGISKKFCRDLSRALFYALVDIGSEVFGLRNSKARALRKKEFWALSNVSFDLRRGESIGLVGANGAGKTTLLKIISGLIKPDQGSISVRGRVAPLIALGAGFNPILSGRENVYVNMSILGLNRKQIDERFEQVVSFAEIGHAIDAPVQTYSSGMSARLGFACAVHTDPDILLVDEVLAVGDMKFRAKCYRKLAELRKAGTTLLLVSHSAQSLSSACTNGILLKQGNVITSGLIGEVLNAYENSLIEIPENETFVPNNVGELFIKSIELGEGNDKFFTYGKSASIRVVLQSERRIEDAKVVIIIRSSVMEGDYSINFDSSRDGARMIVKKGDNHVVLGMDPVGFKAGAYTMKIAVVGENHYVYDAVEAYRFYVSNDTEDVSSSFFQPRSWRIT
jgi:lipopolysaccharide transport system ATP-binding protein